jgi:hypothetical protein
MSSSARVQWYNSTTVRQGGRKIGPLFLAHRLLVMRVSSILMPVCGRVTLLPHPSTEACTLVQPFALCSAFRPSRLAFDSPRLAQIIGIINIIIDRLVLTRAGEPRSTMHPLLFSRLSQPSQPIDDNISEQCALLMPARRSSLSLLCALCTATRLSLHCIPASKPLDASSHLASPSHQTAFPTLLLFCPLSPTPPLSFVQLPPCLPVLVRPVRTPSLPRRYRMREARSHRIAFQNLHPTSLILFGPSPAQRNAPMSSCRTPPCSIR